MKSCSQCKFFYHAQLAKEKEKNMKLSTEFEEAKSEIKRLKFQIEKTNQRQTKTILYYDTIIGDLESLNQEYKKKIESFQSIKERSKKMNISQSKSLNRSFVSHQLCKSTFERYKLQDKQNVNFLNQPQSICCQNIQCTSKIQLIQSRKLLEEIIKELHDLSFIVGYSSKSSEKKEEYNIWAKRLQEQQKMRRRRFVNSSPIQILKYIQENINMIREKAENNENNPVKSTILDAITSLKSKQKSLLQVPFLEKIEFQQLKQDINCLIQSANGIKRSILSKIGKQISN